MYFIIQHIVQELLIFLILFLIFLILIIIFLSPQIISKTSLLNFIFILIDLHYVFIFIIIFILILYIQPFDMLFSVNCFLFLHLKIQYLIMIDLFIIHHL